MHTPGPWCLFKFDDGWHVNQQNGPGFVETVYRIEHRAAECEANAKLIAAAPDLLAALNAMLTHMGMDEDEWNKPTFDQARAAIAKAQG
jgi:hypothetical protein